MPTHNTEGFDKIFIHGLCVNMYAGIYDFEKQKPQRVIINVEIDVSSNKNKEIKNIDDVLSYETICNEIKNICQKQHYDLIETLAEEICTMCLNQKQAQSVTLSIDKPDIIKDTKTVGITIKRTNA